MKLDSRLSPLLVLIPALNEEGAIAGVNREVYAAVPGVPLLVVETPPPIGARRHRCGNGSGFRTGPPWSGGCVQAGYDFAFETGFSF